MTRAPPSFSSARLEDEMDRPGKIPRLREMLCGAEQHRGVAIVAAGMHPPALLRSMGKCVLLVDVQPIHISTQRDRAPALHRSPQGADDARARNSAFDGDTERFQAFGDERSRFMLLERGLWVGVDLVPPSRHFGMKICDAINYRHWRASLLEATAAWRARRLPVDRSSLSRVVARRVLFPLFAKHARSGEVLGSTIGVLFAIAETASGFAKWPSLKAHSNTRQQSDGQDPQPSLPAKNGAAARIPRGASNLASAGQASRPAHNYF